jgi:hypothetical protein
MPIDIYITCEAIDENDTSYPANKIEPPSPINIFKEEDYFISCDFNSLKTGYYEIQINATFKFETTSRLKTFFMNKETVRALRREDKDVYEEYPIIEDTTAIYTEGPVGIGMETTKPPIIVSETGSKPYLGITVENKWEGHISEIIDLYVTPPTGMELYPSLSSCNFASSGQDYRYIDSSKIGTIESYRSFRCRYSVYKTDLDEVPVSTRYFRARVVYYYTLTKSTSVEIEPDVEL